MTEGRRVKKNKTNKNKFITIYKMGKGTTMFGNIKVEKHRFYQQKKLIFIHYVNIDRIVVSNKDRFGKEGFKYFIR